MKYLYVNQGVCEVRSWPAKPSTEELQQAVAGYFECYTLVRDEHRTLQLLVNEYGKPERLAVNFFSDQLGDVIRGAAVICACDPNGEITGMTQEEINAISLAIPPGAKILPRLEVYFDG